MHAYTMPFSHPPCGAQRSHRPVASHPHVRVGNTAWNTATNKHTYKQARPTKHMRFSGNPSAMLNNMHKQAHAPVNTANRRTHEVQRKPLGNTKQHANTTSRTFKHLKNKNTKMRRHCGLRQTPPAACSTDEHAA